jgi:hypothetical protein
LYIGKGCDDRCYSHVREAKGEIAVKRLNSLKHNALKQMLDDGVEPEIVFINELMLSDDAYALEIALIKEFGRFGIDAGGILTNRVITQKSLGGGKKGMKHSKPRSMIYKRTGWIPSPETRELWSRQRKDKKHSKNTINKMREAQSGANNANALNWIVTKPDGNTVKVTALRSWCVENDLKFYDVYNSKNGFVTIKIGKGRGGGRKRNE